MNYSKFNCYYTKMSLVFLLLSAASANAGWIARTLDSNGQPTSDWNTAAQVYQEGISVDRITKYPRDIGRFEHFLWYCDSGDNCPSGSANTVQFHYDLNTRDWDPNAFAVHSLDTAIQADDFFAIYLNVSAN